MQFHEQTHIPTHDMSRKEWLSERRKGLGGSDAAAACGLSRFLSPRQLYHDKRGELEEQPDNDFFYWGRKLERIVLEEAELQTGLEMAPYKYMIWSQKYPWAFVNLDGLISEGGNPVGVVECKTAGWIKSDEWGVSGTDLIPREYVMQCQHALAVTTLQFAVLAVLIGGNQFRWYRVERDEVMIEKIMLIEFDFWEQVQKGVPPQPEYGRDYGTLIKVYGGGNGESIVLSDEAAFWHECASKHCEQEKLHASGKEASRCHLIEMMKGASVGIISNMGEYYFDRRGTFRFRKTNGES